MVPGQHCRTLSFLRLTTLVLTVLSAGCVDRGAGDPRRVPSDWHWIQRTFPYYASDPLAAHAALEQRALVAFGAKTAGRTWTLVGPTNIGGRIVDIEFDPVEPSTVYAAAATGGIFKTTDAGTSWTPIFDDQVVLTVGDIAVSPHDPSVLYAGTGEANGGHNNFSGGGVFKSVNGGRSWDFLGLAETTSIGRVIVDGSNPDRVFVAAIGSYFGTDANRGVFRSDDGGYSWDHVLFVNDSTGVIDLVQHADDPSILLAAAWERVRRPNGPLYLHGSSSGLYRSADGGDSWVRLGASNGLPDPDSFRDPTGRARFGRIGLARGESSPSVAYALYTNGYTYLGLYRSADSGLTWTNADPTSAASGAFGDFSWYFGQVRLHPQASDEVFLLDVLLSRSSQVGESWIAQSGTHVDHHALAFHPENPDILFDGNDGGIAISTDRGRSWLRAGELPVTQFYEITFDPSDPERLFGGTQDNGTVRTASAAAGAWQTILGGDGFYVLVHPDNPDIVFAESQFGALRRSIDGGITFQTADNGIPAAEKRNWSTPVLMDPFEPDVLYYGATRVYRTLDGARTWTAISPYLSSRLQSDRLGTITSLAAAPSDNEVLYAGTDDGNVWVTTDRARTWRRVSAALPLRWVTRIAVDPQDPATAWVTFSGLKWRDPQPHIFRTSDYGSTWSDVSGDLPDAPVNAIALDPDLEETVYAGSDVGAFVSYDTGRSWQRLGDGLPAVPVSDLEIVSEERVLLAGTHGRSMYRMDIGGLLTAVHEPATSDETPRLDAFPNPFSQSATIRLSLDAGDDSRVEVFDVLGRRLQSFNLGGSDASGIRTLRWDGTTASGSDVADGAYVVRIRTAQGQQRSTVLLRAR